MLVPGTWTWSETIPLAVVALLLVYVPGLVLALLTRARIGLAVALAPALSTGVIAVGGMVYGALRVPWTVLAVVITVVAAWLLAFVGRMVVASILRRRSRSPRGEAADSTVDGSTLDDDGDDTHDVRVSPLARLLSGRATQSLATLGGTAFAFFFFAWLFVRSSGTPETFPQHPDTLFHLALPQWMVEHADISYFHALAFTTGHEGGGYPTGMHSMTATLALLTGAPVVVVTSVFVLVVAGVAWPLGMAELVRTALGPTPAAGAVGAVMSVLFTAYPYMLVTFGVLWPNFYGQAVMPGVLVAAAVFLRIFQPGARRRDSLHAGLLGVLCLPGLALAHFNAFVSFAIFGALMALFGALSRARKPVGGWRRWGPLVGTGCLIAVGAIASRVLTPSVMLATGRPGPELTVPEAQADTLFFSPRGTEVLIWLAVLVLLGALMILWRYPSALWAVPAALAMMWLFYINVAIDEPWARTFTWPWYNNAVRIAGVETLPVVILASAAVVGLGSVLAMRLRHEEVLAPALTAVILIGLVLGTGGYRETKYAWMDELFHPRPSHSWASPKELRALRSLAADIPKDAVVAANPWNGGSYMYVVSGRHMLWPTEKTNDTADRRLLGSSLDKIGTDPQVCAAAQRHDVRYAITGGRPFAWGTPDNLVQYVGLDAVGTSPAWEVVDKQAPYTLYRLKTCAS